MATAALVISLVALVISAYSAFAARGERLRAKRADLHVGDSSVLLDGDDYLVELRVTNAGKANAPYLMVSLVTPEGKRLSAPVRATEGLAPDKDVRLTVRLGRANLPPRTPIIHALLAWDDAAGFDHQKVSGHRVRLDEAKERSTEAGQPPLRAAARLRRRVGAARRRDREGSG
jgi:hypothetical protein